MSIRIDMIAWVIQTGIPFKRRKAQMNMEPIRNLHEDPSIVRLNTMPDRAYYLPSGKPDKLYAKPKENSNRLLLLNGDWKFQYYSSFIDVDYSFLSGDTQNYVSIPVPSVWQLKGYDSCQYTNVAYPFPYDPPYVPTENPCGVYVRDFTVSRDQLSGKTYLNFEGVDSCFYLYVNGKFVGYDQVSHNTSEFDITGFITEGNNTIAAVVLKWCDGSYLEDQDKFRFSGIFRDVYLLFRPANHIRDFRITTELSSDYTKAVVRFAPEFLLDPIDVKVSLADAAGNEIARSEGRGALSLSIDQPILWNAEAPYLYTLTLETAEEFIVTAVGVREIHTNDGVVFVNGQRIKFRGVNRHDSDPFVGPAVDFDHMLRDLRLMKEHNVNAIRTSHYPNAPVFLELCDKYGFYVIDEADIEAHGVTQRGEPFTYGSGMRMQPWGCLADEPFYELEILDRIRRMVCRDYNRASVVIWSMGNEAGYGCNFEKALKWVKSVDQSRLTHYESTYGFEGKEYDYSDLDLHSRMYASTEHLDEYFASAPEKPFIHCEYCHAMGNGPGDLEDYFQAIEKYDGHCGAFVWEWCDHAVYAGMAPNGKAIFLYGGDFGELQHDGNFCMDGLVYPDRCVHNGLKEFKNVMRPVRARLSEDRCSVVLHNYLDFLSTDDLLEIQCEVLENGKPVGVFVPEGGWPNVPPHGDAEVSLNGVVQTQGSCHLMFQFVLRKDLGLLKAGHTLGIEQVELKKYEIAIPVLSGVPAFVEDNRTITIYGENFTYIYDKFEAVFRSIAVNGEERLAKPMGINIWRAPTDNDMRVKSNWIYYRYNNIITKVYETKVAESDVLEITANLALTGVSRVRILNAEFVWRVDSKGTISWHADVEQNEGLPFLPRFGLRIFLPKAFEQVEYTGYGPDESYIDKRQHCRFGIFEDRVSNMHEDYLMPQENGSHYGCEQLKLTDGKAVLEATGSFSFNASHYTQEELTQKAHNFELVESDMTVLCLDAHHSGVGSNSCGPALKEQYRVPGHFSVGITFLF